MNTEADGLESCKQLQCQVTANSRHLYNCAVLEDIYTHLMGGHWKFRGGGGLKNQ